ncbi:hypothetical protein KR018_006930, partial [Drosophila ironensis]
QVTRIMDYSSIVQIIILFVGGIAGWTAEKVIGQLNRDFGSVLNVYFDCADRDLWFDDNVSVLQLNSDIKHEKLLGRFSEKALIVACFKESSINRTWRGVKDYLWALQHLPILYVSNSSTGEEFKEALSRGFLRVLSLNLSNGSLYTYEPYPNIRTHQIEDLGEFARLTKLKNLQGYKVKITVETMSPRCFHYQNRQRQKTYAGYMYKVVSGFVSQYNGTVTHVLEDTDPIPYEQGMKILLNNEVDFVPRILFPLEWRYYYHSYFLYNVNTFFIVPWAEPLPKSLYFIRPFDWKVWAAFLVTFVYASIAIWWIKFHQQDAASASLASTFMNVLQLMVLLPISNQWHFSFGLRQVLAFMVLFLFGFILTNLYTAQMSSSLTTGLYKQQINSFDDIVHEKYPLLLESMDTESVMTMSRQKLIPMGLRDIISETTLEMVLYNRKNLNTSYVYLAFEDRIEFELYQQKYLRVPLFKKLPEVFIKRPFFVPIRHGLPYVELFNDYLLRIWESGIYRKLRSDAYFEGISSGEISFRKSTGREIQVFDTEFYYFAYILLGLGWLISCVVFLAENLKKLR